ncbi:SDR family oxidoreductase [Mycolicibacterium sp. P1-18]|uniref:SDR family NAD(P)-dependent oxidoreductase n=1 Tax=Mycolicibacterium sp. P1-18 TaxID=2024615 RepID=UPI0011F1105E|nr:SDR family oxidoreductase [Mycolicibacterium sp. P1-18]KAA0091412.1 SDR family oxidoreductase [Mycolicibacterium sp. P1-18]
MSSPLAGKTALVTGGSRGIGAAITARLAADGATVAFSYARAADTAADLVKTLSDGGATAQAFQADQADPASCARLVGEVVAAFGPLDILVNSAGVYKTETIDDPERDDSVFAAQLQTNVVGVLATTRAAVLNFNDGGRIVTIGTTGAAHAPFPGIGDYVATKAALAAYTRAWSRDLGPRRITVNIVQPGAVDTDMNPADGPNADLQKSMNSLGRFADPGEVAALVAFLAGPEAGFITGTTVNIDGGLSA